ncbi:MAG: hypothetical protein V4490_02250, partial [Pseudomonadota bacterium]
MKRIEQNTPLTSAHIQYLVAIKISEISYKISYPDPTAELASSLYPANPSIEPCTIAAFILGMLVHEIQESIKEPFEFAFTQDSLSRTYAELDLILQDLVVNDTFDEAGLRKLLSLYEQHRSFPLASPGITAQITDFTVLNSFAAFIGKMNQTHQGGPIRLNLTDTQSLQLLKLQCTVLEESVLALAGIFYSTAQQTMIAVPKAPRLYTSKVPREAEKAIFETLMNDFRAVITPEFTDRDQLKELLIKLAEESLLLMFLSPIFTHMPYLIENLICYHVALYEHSVTHNDALPDYAHLHAIQTLARAAEPIFGDNERFFQARTSLARHTIEEPTKAPSQHSLWALHKLLDAMGVYEALKPGLLELQARLTTMGTMENADPSRTRFHAATFLFTPLKHVLIHERKKILLSEIQEYYTAKINERKTQVITYPLMSDRLLYSAHFMNMRYASSEQATLTTRVAAHFEPKPSTAENSIWDSAIHSVKSLILARVIHDNLPVRHEPLLNALIKLHADSDLLLHGMASTSALLLKLSKKAKEPSALDLYNTRCVIKLLNALYIQLLRVKLKSLSHYDLLYRHNDTDYDCPTEVEAIVLKQCISVRAELLIQIMHSNDVGEKSLFFPEEQSDNERYVEFISHTQLLIGDLIYFGRHDLLRPLLDCFLNIPCETLRRSAFYELTIFMEQLVLPYLSDTSAYFSVLSQMHMHKVVHQTTAQFLELFDEATSKIRQEFPPSPQGITPHETTVLRVFHELKGRFNALDTPDQVRDTLHAVAGMSLDSFSLKSQARILSELQTAVLAGFSDRAPPLPPFYAPPYTIQNPAAILVRHVSAMVIENNWGHSQKRATPYSRDTPTFLKELKSTLDSAKKSSEGEKSTKPLWLFIERHLPCLTPTQEAAQQDPVQVVATTAAIIAMYIACFRQESLCFTQTAQFARLCTSNAPKMNEELQAAFLTYIGNRYPRNLHHAVAGLIQQLRITCFLDKVVENSPALLNRFGLNAELIAKMQESASCLPFRNPECVAYAEYLQALLLSSSTSAAIQAQLTERIAVVNAAPKKSAPT